MLGLPSSVKYVNRSKRPKRVFVKREGEQMSHKPMLLIPSNELPNHVLCVGIKTPTETIVVHKKNAKK